MKAVRLLGFVFAIAALALQVMRLRTDAVSYATVSNDVFCAAAVLVASILLHQDTTRRRAFLASSWALNAGLYYDKIDEAVASPAQSAAAYAPLAGAPLFGVLALLFLLALFCFIVSVLHKRVHVS